jgi:hypothetical protein
MQRLNQYGANQLKPKQKLETLILLPGQFQFPTCGGSL